MKNSETASRNGAQTLTGVTEAGTEPTAPSPHDPASAAIAAALTGSVRRLLDSEPAARMGEVEGIHQMRGAARRIRSVLRTFADLIDPAWAEGLEHDLHWLTRVLGEARDLDILEERFRDEAGDDPEGLAPLLRTLADRQAVARAAVEGAIASERYGDLVARLTIAARAPQVTEAAAEPCRDVLPPLVADAWKVLAKAERRLDEDDSDAAYHKVRIRAKRARYAAEAVAPALRSSAAKQARRFARRAARVQDLLGRHQDAVVARATLQQALDDHPGDPAFGRTAGDLLERLVEEAADLRDRFPRLWKKLDRKKRRKWMKV